MYCRDGIGGWGGGYFYNKMKSENCETDGTVPKFHRKKSQKGTKSKPLAQKYTTAYFPDLIQALQ